MQLRLNLTSSYIFWTALIALLTWTSLAQGAAIRRDISSARRDVGEKARFSGVDVSNDNVLRDSMKFATKPEGELLAERDTDGTDGFVDDWYTLAVRDTEVINEQSDMDDYDHPTRRWYTLVEIAENQDSELA